MSADRRAGSVHERVRRPRPARVPVECGDLPFLIKRDGTWLYRGTPDQPEGTGLPVLQRAAARGGRQLLAANPGRARPHRGGGRAVRRGGAGLDRRRARTRCCPSAPMSIRWSPPGRTIRSASSHDLLTCEPTPYILVRPGAGDIWRSRRGSTARSITNWWRWRCREWVGSKRMLGVWSRGQFFSLGELPPGEA